MLKEPGEAFFRQKINCNAMELRRSINAGEDVSPVGDSHGELPFEEALSFLLVLCTIFGSTRSC